MGHFRVNFFHKNWDLPYRHIYLGHPLKLKGVWANIKLGDFTGATPTGCQWTAYQCCQTLCICLMWMGFEVAVSLNHDVMSLF